MKERTLLWQDPAADQEAEASEADPVAVDLAAPEEADSEVDHAAALVAVTDPVALAVITDLTIITTIITDPSSLDGTDPSLAMDTEAVASVE